MRIYFLLILLAVINPTMSVAQRIVPLNENNVPDIRPFLSNYSMTYTSNYQNYVMKGDGGIGTSYETNTMDFSTHTSQTVTVDVGSGTLVDYTFSGKDKTVSNTSRTYAGNKYPPMYHNCITDTQVKPRLHRDAQGTIVAYDAVETGSYSCVRNLPNAPVNEKIDNVYEPAPERYKMSNMKPVHCSKVEPYFSVNYFEDDKELNILSGINTTQEDGTIMVRIGGDPSLEYNIIFEMFAVDATKDLNNPTPVRIDGSTVNDQAVPGGGAGGRISGWFKGQSFYPVGVTTSSKCYIYGILQTSIGRNARRS